MRQAYDYWQDQPDSYRVSDVETKRETKQSRRAPRSTPKKTDRCGERCKLEADIQWLHGSPRFVQSKRDKTEQTVNRALNRRLHARRGAHQATRCGLHGSFVRARDSARQFVKPPYERRDAIAIDSSRAKNATCFGHVHGRRARQGFSSPLSFNTAQS